MSPYNLESFNHHPFNPFSNVFALRLNSYTCACLETEHGGGTARGHLTHARPGLSELYGQPQASFLQYPTAGMGSARQFPRRPLPEIGRPPGNPSPASKALPGPARPLMALTVQRKAVMCRPARFAPPAQPQHLAAPLQPSRGLPHGCGRRMAGRAAARARLGIREAVQALPFRPTAPPPAAKMAAGRGPSSNHFRFLYGRRGRWRECFPAEGRGWRKCAVLHRRSGVLGRRTGHRCFGCYGLQDRAWPRPVATGGQ